MGKAVYRFFIAVTLLVCAGQALAAPTSLRHEQARWAGQGKPADDRWFHVHTAEDGMPVFVDLDGVVGAGPGIHLVVTRSVPMVPGIRTQEVIMRFRINCRAGTVSFEKTPSLLESMRNPQPELPISAAQWYTGEIPARGKAAWDLRAFVCG